MEVFGFFKGMKYGDCEEEFEKYKNIKNEISKRMILKYLKRLPITAICPMSTEDIFDGEEIEQAGIIEDGDFMFPLDFIHYYEKYDIGIPLKYEKYIKDSINKMLEETYHFDGVKFFL